MGRNRLSPGDGNCLITKEKVVSMSYNKYLQSLMEQAKLKNKTIVLPEGEDMRILEAAHIIAAERVAKLVILGDEAEIKAHFAKQGWNLGGIEIVKPENSPRLAEYTKLLYDLRKDKGLTEEDAAKLALNYNYFGTLMIKSGHADGMVSGANHSTADTVRPALQIIKSAKKGRAVSSFFLLVFGDKTYLLSDCGIVIDPTDREMADIALDAAESALKFGLEPKVAMLSYSTYGSGKGERVDKVKRAVEMAKADLQTEEVVDKVVEALKIAKEMAPDIAIDGELQADAALDGVVAKKKAPGSDVAGQANVLIFPSLEAGNIGYKLLQRLGGCDAYGPLLQGLNAPVNDLSRGALVEDIVGVIAITCLQA